MFNAVSFAECLCEKSLEFGAGNFLPAGYEETQSGATTFLGI